MLWSSNPFFRSAKARPTSSGTLRNGSGSGTATTVSSSSRRRVIVDEQLWQSQKCSTSRLDLHVQRAGSLSRQKSLPSCREQNDAEQEGLLHFASITALRYLCLVLCDNQGFVSITLRPLSAVSRISSLNGSPADPSVPHNPTQGKFPAA